MNRYLVLIFFFGCSLNALGQSQSSAIQDSLVQKEFDHYLDHVLSQPRDSVLVLDTSTVYKFNFVSHCPYQQGISTSDYHDSNSIICIKSIERGTDAVSISTVDTIINPYIKMEGPVFAAPLDIKSIDYMDLAFTVISFSNGKYLIAQDIMITQHGGQSSGFARSIFLEKLD